MSRGVVLLGVGMTRFGKMPERKPEDLGHEAVRAAIRDAGIDRRKIQAAFVGSVYLPSGIGQRILKDLGLTGIPIINVENSCASGGTAVREAYAWIKAELCDVALALGVESLSRSLPSGMIPLDLDDLAPAMGLVMPAAYALAARRHMEEYGTTPEQFALVTVKSRSNAGHNPYAYFHQALSLNEVLASRMVADPITKYQCTINADGAAAAILCSENLARQYTTHPVCIVASAMGSGKLRDRIGDLEDTAARIAREAYEAAGIGPEDIDVCELHDAFSVGEVLYCESLGLCPEGEGGRYTQAGQFNINGEKAAVNTSGGLLSRGHPLGATGIAQLAELVWQLRGEAAGRQVDPCRVALQHNSGGGVFDIQTNACVIQILVRE
jgi:acetyl-CoA acetyltransferase